MEIVGIAMRRIARRAGAEQVYLIKELHMVLERVDQTCTLKVVRESSVYGEKKAIRGSCTIRRICLRPFDSDFYPEFCQNHRRRK